MGDDVGSRAHLQAPGAYRFPRDEGGYCYLIYRDIDQVKD